MLLFVVAALGGALNAVAGGGSFLVLPALLYAGVSPVAANATTTLVLWPASIASAWAYRRFFSAAPAQVVALGGASLVGGLLGALLLVRTSDVGFMRLLPWLMLLAAGTFSFGGTITKRFRGGEVSRPAGRPSLWATAVQLAIAVYGGYFGGGMGIMMLATMSLAGMTDLHQMNGLKSLLAVAINGIALAEFVANGTIAWSRGLPMIAGAVAGGYAGAALARQVDVVWVRRLVVVVGWSMTVWFFVR